MAKFTLLDWVSCDSRGDMEARTVGVSVIDTLIIGDANAWGYISVSDGRFLNIGYVNVGLRPQALIAGNNLIVGINQRLVGYGRLSGAKVFSYQMPFVFHEYIDIDTDIIVRDEMGFAATTPDGNELWVYYVEGVIEDYRVDRAVISGETMDGLSFRFALPIT